MLAHLQAPLILFLLFILGHDLGWDDSRHRHSENAWVHCQEKHEPLVAVRPILDFPLLGLGIPGVSATDRRSDLLMSQRC